MEESLWESCNKMRGSKAKATGFTERLSQIVKQYNDRSDTTIADEVIEEVVNQMEQLLHEINKEKDIAKEMGISYQVKSIYDILLSVRDKFGFEYANDKFITLAIAIRRQVTLRRLVHPRRPQSRAQDGHRPRPRRPRLSAIYEGEVFKKILEQAENFKKYQEKKLQYEKIFRIR